MFNKLFLLIDDDDDDRELFQIALKNAKVPVNCVTCSSCIEALEKIEDINPDYIFLDLNMPMMSGKECLIELKKRAFTKDIPVVIFSTSSEASDITETKALGAIDFITKPSKVSELTYILNNFIIKRV